MVAPLVPDLINNDINLLVAIVVGFGFGYTLEQAGFSSTKKLAGVFYGYDFTVLRVFFTAGITAMLGITILGKLGWLDVSLIYVNPTFLYSAMIGGAVMGLGFIIGGFCPGTSIVGAVIGRIDAMIFVGGAILGVFVYGEMFPLLKGIYAAEAMGPLTSFEVLGLSKEVYVVILTLVALGAFVMTYYIQQRVNGKEAVTLKTVNKKYLAFGVVMIIPALVIFFTPDKEERLFTAAHDQKQLEQNDFAYYTPDKLAYKIMKQDSAMNVIDVRSKEAFDAQNIPTSFNIPLEELQDRKYEVTLSKPSKINVIYADHPEQAKSAAYILKELNYPNVYILDASTEAFYQTIMMPYELQASAGLQEQFNHRFRSKARVELPAIAEKLKQKPVIRIVKKKKIQGGCS
ncbi:rhodanese-like domain-containing protein [Algivirga pacifica]|uniref:Rhodanese domain-containing protein n=1 Tax=Algivirga pacifica TaxID=1162670 RepID=A0ABP9DCR4_9BACT